MREPGLKYRSFWQTMGLVYKEEGRLDREYYEKMDEADKFEREARELEAEAARLEWESR